MNKQQILEKLSSREPRIVKFECSDLGTVYLREMSGTQRDKFEISVSEEDLKSVSVRAILVCRHLCDEQGNVFEFSDIERESFADGISGAALDKLFDECRKLSGMLGDEEGN